MPASLSTTISRDTKSDDKNEKARVTVLPHVEEEDKDEAQAIAGDERNEITQEEDDAVKRKIDKRVIPILAAVYFSQVRSPATRDHVTFEANFPLLFHPSVPRQELSQLLLHHGPPDQRRALQPCLDGILPGFRYFWCVTAPPDSTKYLGVNMCLWATVLILHAVSANFAPFFVFRVLLGVFECCVSPILIAMIASWYRKNEQAKRVGCFYVMNGITSMVGGLMAYGVTFYKGTAIAHWRIMYILLGGMAFIVAICVLVWLPDSPATANFLTEREKLVAIERVRDNQSGTVNKHYKRHQVFEALKDPKTWFLVSLSLLSSVPNGALASFNSILIKSFGYTSRISLLLNVPQGFIAAVTTISLCYWADKSSSRMLPVLGAVLPALLGASLIVGFSGGSVAEKNHHKGVLLFGIMIIQSYGTSLALFYSWSASNVAGGTKKTVVNALFLTSFGASNIVGTQIFTAASAPGYIPGKIVILVLFALMIPVTLAARWYTNRMNAKKRAVLAQMVIENNWSEEDLAREADRHAVSALQGSQRKIIADFASTLDKFLDLTDIENPFFMYTS
ncbi:MFS transporter, ACS family, allantoate permease, partial [Phenoliferia sp. Uapishka_3]